MMRGGNLLKSRIVTMYLSVALFLLLRQEAMAFLKPWALLSRVSARFVTTKPSRLHFLALHEQKERKFDNENDARIASELDQTKLLVQAQQEKIDKLMNLLISSTSSGAEAPKQEKNNFSTSHVDHFNSHPILPPLKAMLFIDGTWLYYSLYERGEETCPIIQRYGKGWIFKYNINWGGLPRIICQALQEQEKKKGWSANSPGSASQHMARPIEITRVSVFTSYKPDTPKTSYRYQMFQEMLKARFDVHMMETLGRGEKCVDIQLAVDMLHYATVPDAYDVALLLTGDKDFMPAMVRCRQKGRRVGLVSMRGACNQALCNAPNLKDFDVIFLEDHLDDFLTQKTVHALRHVQPSVSVLTLITIIKDFILGSGLPRVSSRDIGRYIKTVYVGDRCILHEIKQVYGGLYQFLIVSDAFVVDMDAGKEFWVAIRESVDAMIQELTKNTIYTTEERIFFEKYDLSCLEDTETCYSESIGRGNQPSYTPSKITTPKAGLSSAGQDRASPESYEKLTVVMLKELCRERALPVSGKKVDLIQRLLESDESLQSKDPITPVDYIEALVSEYLQVKGGVAGSRDLGRYLQANRASEEFSDGTRGHVSALQELKANYGSVRRYIMSSEKFVAEETDDEGTTNDYEFQIRFSDHK